MKPAGRIGFLSFFSKGAFLMSRNWLTSLCIAAACLGAFRAAHAQYTGPVYPGGIQYVPSQPAPVYPGTFPAQPTYPTQPMYPTYPGQPTYPSYYYPPSVTNPNGIAGATSSSSMRWDPYRGWVTDTQNTAVLNSATSAGRAPAPGSSIQYYNYWNGTQWVRGSRWLGMDGQWHGENNTTTVMPDGSTSNTTVYRNVAPTTGGTSSGATQPATNPVQNLINNLIPR